MKILKYKTRFNSNIIFVLISIFAFHQFSLSQVKNSVISQTDIYNHIKYLASDELEGRYPGTKGDMLAQKYICSHFSNFGLIPKGTEVYVQKFEMVTGLEADKNNTFSITQSGKKSVYYLYDDFTPLGFTANGNTKGELVFVGYGISSRELNYDDYTNKDGNIIDVTGKILVMLRYSPSNNTLDKNIIAKAEQYRSKILTAIEKKAAGIIFITGPQSDDEDILPILSFDIIKQTADIPIIFAKRNIIEKLFKKKNLDLSKIQKDIDANLKPHPFLLRNVIADISTSVIESKTETGNVIGFLEGTDSVLKKETIVIGAHYDHLGYGFSNSLSEGNDLQIHYGADDNASGTAGVLELCKQFSLQKDKLKRSILFICFAAEEAGLIGSSYFTNSPLFSEFNITAMINMDMIGRLREDKLIINGTGTSSFWNSTIDSINRFYNFSITKLPEGVGPSDHSSFYIKDIPVLQFFTDLHEDYHKPTDVYTKINVEGEEKILNFVYELALHTDTISTKIDFVRFVVEEEKEKQERRGFRVSVGTIPDFTYTDNGFKISGVKAGSPAEKAGLQAGDIIIKFGDKEIKDIYDYTDVLSQYKPDDEVDIVVLRNNEKVTLKVKLGRR